MRTHEGGQVIIIVAVALMVILLILALIIDGARLMVERQELNRAADAAGKAGLIIVGDQMVTQVVAAQTASASITISPTALGGTPGPTLTPTPAPDDFYSWLNDSDRQTLVSPPIQTLVATQVLGSAEENDLGLSNPVVTDLVISYPVVGHRFQRSQSREILNSVDSVGKINRYMCYGVIVEQFRIPSGGSKEVNERLVVSLERHGGSVGTGDNGI